MPRPNLLRLRNEFCLYCKNATKRKVIFLGLYGETEDMDTIKRFSTRTEAKKFLKESPVYHPDLWPNPLQVGVIQTVITVK